MSVCAGNPVWCIYTARGVGLALSPSAHVGSFNHGDLALILHSKKHDTYAFILKTLTLFWGGLGQIAL